MDLDVFPGFAQNDLPLYAAETLDPNLPGRLERFVGREKEIQQLLSCAAEALDGHGRLVLLSGEPGIGKTRLATEFARHLENLGIHAFWGRCWEGEGAPPFWPWVQILRALLNIQITPAANHDPYIEDVARLLPELKDLNQPEESPPESDLDAPEIRFRLFDSVWRLLQHHSNNGPVAIFLDDLHRADEPTLRLLQYLAPTISSAPILLVATTRPMPSPQPVSPRDIFALSRHPQFAHIPITGFSTNEIASILSSSATPDRDRYARFLQRQTAGNPFFLLELLRDTCRRAQAQVPPRACSETNQTLTSIINSRISSLSQTSRQLLVIASVGGYHFSLPALRAVAQSQQIPPPTLDLLITEAVDSALVTFSTAQGIFRHALIRDFLYQSTPPIERSKIHAAILTALETLHSKNLIEIIETLAHHALQAAAHIPELLGAAIRHSRAAAEQATKLLAHEDAATHLQNVLEILPGDQQYDEVRCETLLQLGNAQDHSGLWSEARSSFLQAARFARERAWYESFASAAIGFAGHGGSTAPPDQEAINLLREAYSAIMNTDSPTIIRVLSKLAIVLHTTSTDEKDSLSDSALRRASSHTSPELLAAALDARAHALSNPTQLDLVLSHATELLTLSQSSGSLSYQIRAHLYRYMAYLHTGDRGAEIELDVSTRLAAELRHPTFLWKLSSIRTARAIANGQFELAEMLTLDTYELGKRVHDRSAAQIRALHTYFLTRDRLDLSELDLKFSFLYESGPTPPFLHAGLALLYCLSGYEPEANRIVDQILLNVATALPLNSYYLFTLALLADIAYYLKRLDLARITYSQLAPFAHLNVVVSWGAAFDGPVTHFLGLLSATLGQRKKSYSYFEAALKTLEPANQTGLLARTTSAFAEELLKSDDRQCRNRGAALQEAHASLQRSLGLSDRLPFYLARVQSTAEAATGSPPGFQLVPQTDPNRTISAQRGEVPQLSMRRIGDSWIVRFRDDAFYLRTGKSIRQLAYLLEQPGVPFSALVLSAVGQSDRGITSSTAASTPETTREMSATITRLDTKALASYRQRLKELHSELNEARILNDLGRIDALSHELEWIDSMIRRDTGLMGRSRAVPNEEERARVSVRNNLTSIIRRIEAFDPCLREHLVNSVKTGRLCTYAPSPPCKWSISA